MQIIQPAHIKDAQTWPSSKFADWLALGISKYHSNSAQDKLRAFEPYQRFFHVQTSLQDELTCFWEALNNEAKNNFWSGCGIAIKKTRAVEANLNIFKEIVEFSGAVKWGPDVVLKDKPMSMAEIIADKVKSSVFFSSLDDEERQDLFDFTLYNLGRLSEVAADDRALRRIVQSAFFKPRYAPYALFAMIQASPNALAQHIRNLSPHFETLRQEHTDNWLEQLQEGLGQALSPVDVAELLKDMRYSIHDSHANDATKSDNWFVRALLEPTCQQAPFVLSCPIDEGDDWEISSRHDVSGQQKESILLPVSMQKLDAIEYVLREISDTRTRCGLKKAAKKDSKVSKLFNIRLPSFFSKGTA